MFFGASWLSLQRWLALTIAIAFGATIVASIAGMLAPPARAATVETRSTTVRVDDLDLATAAGEARLRRRVASAARELCGLTGVAAIAASGQTAACIESAKITPPSRPSGTDSDQSVVGR